MSLAITSPGNFKTARKGRRKNLSKLINFVNDLFIKILG